MPSVGHDQALRAALTRTVPQHAFDAEGLKRWLETGTPPEPPAPKLGSAGIGARLAERGFDGIGAPRRYEVLGTLGVGATGRVYTVVDRNLDRPVAVKVLAPERSSAGDIASFVEEARLTASLSHPNVLPVYELDLDEQGRAFFTMKKIDGRSLGDAIDESSPARRAAPLDEPNALVSVFIDVCQALAYAHHRRIVHQDVKPANIMLGAFGEVLLVDWGSAHRLVPGAPPRIYGTPLYMSPEQARRETVDARSDVYAVGATLFHALTLRVPTWHDDPGTFFAMKRAGEIAPPGADERARAPAPLLAIALKAMAPSADDRYRDAEALLADLRAWQAGLAVNAHRDSLVERARRWYRLHARTVWTAAVAAVVVAALAAALLGERLKEIATWGAPILVERFADDGWRERWTVMQGQWDRRDGRLVTSGIDGHVLLLNRKLWGAVRLDYEAEMLPGTPPCDLSVIWCRDVERDEKNGIGRLIDPYYLQFGAVDASYTGILREGSVVLVSSDVRPEPGRRYHVRAEVDGERMSLSIDGKLACEWLDSERFDGGYLAFYGFYEGKAFGDVRVSVRGEPQRMPATAVGDALLRAGRIDLAIEQYERVADGPGATGLREQARFAEGLCLWRKGRRAEADAAWAPLAGTAYGPRVELEQLERPFAAGDHAAVIAVLDRLAGHVDEEIRKRAGMRWSHFVGALVSTRRAPETDAAIATYMTLYDRRFAGHDAYDNIAARALLRCGRDDEVLTRFPRQDQQCCVVFERQRRYDQIIARYWGQRWERTYSLLQVGRSAEIDRDYQPSLYGEGLVQRGRPVEALNYFHGDARIRHKALRELGQLEESLRDARGIDRAYALALLGRADEVIDGTADDCAIALLERGDAASARHVAGPGLWHELAAARCALDAWAAGDAAAAAALFDEAAAGARDEFAVWFDAVLVPAFLRGADAGDWTAYDARVAAGARDRWPLAQRPWHACRFLAGEIDEAAFLAQPHGAYADARLALLRAMRAERAGEAGAVAAYRAWLALPRWRRYGMPDVAVEAFARARLARLDP